MTNTMRQPTIDTLGLGTVLDIFKHGRLPAEAGDLVDRVFGPKAERGSVVISGANGIVGAGKTMQLGSRLEPFDVPIVALDFPNAPDGIGAQYPGLVNAFGQQAASRIMANVIRLSYDGRNLPDEMKAFRPRFLLEAIPEILEIKKAHYQIFTRAFPGIEIRSVTSGFPMAELGVGIAHPAFPHQVNKIFEMVEERPSDVTRLLWSLGLIPMPVSDHWSFVLDVLFCGLMQAAVRYGRVSNMPYWKIDKYTRRLLGPNPLRAHDAIGAKGANFLTWSCLHHLSLKYGGLFTPTPELEEHKDSGANWYPPDHFRPMVNWSLDVREEEDFNTWLLGPMFQMASLLIHEKRSHLSHMNAIGELCAQFRRGVLAVIRATGADQAIKRVEQYHAVHPEAARGAWHPDAFGLVDTPEWQQLYVNAEHDGTAGVITLARESYNGDVDQELNRAMDWLLARGVTSVIVTGDFHMSTQMVGADTSEFYGALEDTSQGLAVSRGWSRTARRLHNDFKHSVGVVTGKRCLGGMLELLMHCHTLLAVEGAELGMPEVTLPVVPGMEGCHWPFRKATPDQWPKLLHLLLGGRPVKARDAAGWLVDGAMPLEACLKTAWSIVTGGDHGIKARPVKEGALKDFPRDAAGLPDAGGPEVEQARAALMDSIRGSCASTLAEALDVQARHSAEFMVSKLCRKGVIGADCSKVMAV